MITGGKVDAGKTGYLATTDSQEGWVFMPVFARRKIKEVARLNLGKTQNGEVVQAATAVRLSTTWDDIVTLGGSHL